MSEWVPSEFGGWLWHDGHYVVRVHEDATWSAVGWSTTRMGWGAAATVEQAQAEALAKVEQWRAER